MKKRLVVEQLAAMLTQKPPAVGALSVTVEVSFSVPTQTASIYRPFLFMSREISEVAIPGRVRVRQ